MDHSVKDTTVNMNGHSALSHQTDAIGMDHSVKDTNDTNGHSEEEHDRFGNSAGRRPALSDPGRAQEMTETVDGIASGRAGNSNDTIQSSNPSLAVVLLSEWRKALMDGEHVFPED
ncbi:hypothetical protein KIN20_034330 [Parelaphostrongylus tenuis]|uniref:Uncharacterized protein n=1 Tax=Parelaphostrongylus tenuis TaxID=148309 RepID=A0AAD5WJY9_PARTN|nr:hypothetical protein KIN20_034330 [Parelaphostrongylus tenuis]